MIAFLEGRLETTQSNAIVLNVNGVGYRVEISTQTHDKLPEEGERVKLLIHHHFTDSDQRLFGFFSSKELQLFEKLITVKGVGPKLALVIMSGMEASQLVEAIARKDHQSLSTIPGIGKKTAERIILELKEKIFESEVQVGLPDGKGPSSKREAAIAALGALGFKKRDAENAVIAITGENSSADVPEIVKMALKQQDR